MGRKSKSRRSKLTPEQERIAELKAANKISQTMVDNDNEYSDDAMKLLQGMEGDVGKSCRKCLKKNGCKKQNCSKCKSKCKNINTDETNDTMSAKELAKLKKQLKKVKKKSKEQKEEESIETQQRRANFAQGTQRFRGIDKQNAERDARARRRSANKKKRNSFTTEPIPDYILRAIQPKKNVHSVYGKLRY